MSALRNSLCVSAFLFSIFVKVVSRSSLLIAKSLINVLRMNFFLSLLSSERTICLPLTSLAVGLSFGQKFKTRPAGWTNSSAQPSDWTAFAGFCEGSDMEKFVDGFSRTKRAHGCRYL
jgi:hypothetical protein